MLRSSVMGLYKNYCHAELGSASAPYISTEIPNQVRNDAIQRTYWTTPSFTKIVGSSPTMTVSFGFGSAHPPGFGFACPPGFGSAHLLGFI